MGSVVKWRKKKMSKHKHKKLLKKTKHQRRRNA
ncbi:MAG: AURKAIP1/COX24 domain-containing protein [Nitrospiraceae bacterium]|nr:AURKAIP1/COX24 domain-containing protein [Nitrospiraceae bacterium]